MEYRAIDLFAGAGGFSSGFSMEAFNIVAAVEKVEVFCKTHHTNFKNSTSLAQDIKTLPPKDFSSITGIKKGEIDVVIGSPPCQTFSTIGVAKINSVRKKSIITDPRNYLFKYYFDYVDYFRPPIFVMENVPTMQTRYKGTLFNKVLDQIEKLGYEPHVSVENSVGYGVPQTRKRLFVVGTQSGIKFNPPSETHYSFACGDDKSNQSEFKSHTTVSDAIMDLPLIYDGCRENKLPYSKNRNLTDYQIMLRNSDGYVENNICRVSNERAKRVFSHMKQGDRYMDLSPEIRAILPFREDIFHDRLKRLDLKNPSWTILAHIGMDGYMYIHPTEDRTLSVREAARIQSFHDSFLFIGNMREQYIQVGNAVPPLLAKAYAKSIKEALK